MRRRSRCGWTVSPSASTRRRRRRTVPTRRHRSVPAPERTRWRWLASEAVVPTSPGSSTTCASGRRAAPAATTTGLASSANPAVAGVSVTFTATVTGAAPTGVVQFFDNGAVIGAAARSRWRAAATAGRRRAARRASRWARGRSRRAMAATGSTRDRSAARCRR
ncbi:MAG: Ig-like domain repeat protein [Betaproteobacteria bacterium]|nr:Ig-like domain repeat protein [Betaproteobacteria bacterium]